MDFYNKDQYHHQIAKFLFTSLEGLSTVSYAHKCPQCYWLKCNLYKMLVPASLVRENKAELVYKHKPLVTINLGTSNKKGRHENF